MASIDHTAYEKDHQVSLIKSILLVVIGFSLFAGLTNFAFFDSYLLGSLNVVSVILSLLVAFYYHRSANVKVTSWLLCGIVVFNMLSLIGITKGSSYTLIWMTILPPICFFLLGRKGGSWAVGLSFGIVAGYVFYMRTEKITSSFTNGAFLNIFCAFVVLWLLFRHYEESRENAYSALERLSITDKLTGLNNRSRLDEILTEQLGIANRMKQPMIVVLADCDHFKVVNDKYGHLYGDYVLKTLAEILVSHVREGDFVGRWGGEEFLIVCPDTTIKEAEILIERLREKIASFPLRLKRNVTMTFGIAGKKENDDMTNIVNRADKALYQGKKAGRNTVKVYE